MPPDRTLNIIVATLAVARSANNLATLTTGALKVVSKKSLEVVVATSCQGLDTKAVEYFQGDSISRAATATN